MTSNEKLLVTIHTLEMQVMSLQNELLDNKKSSDKIINNLHKDLNKYRSAYMNVAEENEVLKDKINYMKGNEILK